MPRELGSLPIGALIKDTTTKFYNTPIIWKVAAKNHSGYPANSVTLITDRIITLRCSDAKEPSNSNSDRQSYGNNRHIYSNIRRWLNSEAGAGGWYAAQHAQDAPPNTANVWDSKNPYDTQAGFLNTFSNDFRNALLTTTLKVVKSSTDGGGSETFTDKIFLASNTEVGLANESSITEGAKLALFTDNASRLAKPTSQAVSNSNYTNASLNANSNWYWWLRTPYASISRSVRFVHSDGTLNYYYACYGNSGVRPLCNLLSSILVSDNTDSDGAYTIVWNRPPTPPASITVPTSIYSGQTANIAWSASSDPDGDSISYRLERSINGGGYTQVYSGAATSYADNITTAMNTVQYRVKAVDSFGASSGYTTSPNRPVIHNLPPVISGIDQNLGVKNDGFSYTYTVTDAESNPTVVEERVDGVLIRSYTPELGVQQQADVKAANWVKLSQGSHTLTIKATDSQNGTATRTLTFTKSVNTLFVTLGQPMAATAKPTRINIEVKGEIPAGATFKVETCNNAFDLAPDWEDATDAVKAHLAYVFSNQFKQAESWGVNIKVTLERGEAIGDCYITGVGGTWE